MSNWNEKFVDWRAPIHEDLYKSKYKEEAPAHGINSLLQDPYSLQQAMGFKDRHYSISYNILKTIPTRLSIISAILQTRCNQVASFSAPYRLTKSLGYEIKHKNPNRLTTKGEREMILSMEQFIFNCGHNTPNPKDPENFKRDDFDTFLRKFVRDSLTFDSACAEIVPTHKGTPYEFVCVDASTIRIAANSVGLVPDETWYDRNPVVNNPALLNVPFNPYTSLKYRAMDQRPAYVQVVNGQICQAYTKDELIFGVRNPRSDVLIQGYGFSELEQLVTIITSHLNAEEYNKRFFLSGSAPKGILNFKGDTMSPEQLEVFKRQWKSNIEGVHNSWSTPILQSEQGLEWIDMHRSNQDMEYSKWVEYLIKIITGVYSIDPAEINFDLSGGVSQTPLFESSSEWKLKASRDKGLKPLLKFVAKTINDNIIARMDDAFYFDFVGLDELTEQEKHELSTEQLSSYLTLNEVRRSKDLPDIEDGDVVLNSVYLQAKTTQMQLDAQKAQEPQQGAGAGPEQGNPGAGQGPSGQDEGASQETVEPPSYADRFTKSVNNTKILEISLDDESWYDLV